MKPPATRSLPSKRSEPRGDETGFALICEEAKGYTGGALNCRQLDHLEMEPAGREQGRCGLHQSRPREIGRRADRRVQIKQELVGEAADRRRLPEGQAQTHRVLHAYAVRRNGFFHQQVDETAPAGMRPDVWMQQVAQGFAALKGDFALPDPLENRIAPLPARNQVQVLFGEIERQIELALLDHAVIGRNITQDILRLDDPSGHPHHFGKRRSLACPVYQQRRQFMGSATRDVDVPSHNRLYPYLSTQIRYHSVSICIMKLTLNS